MTAPKKKAIKRTANPAAKPVAAPKADAKNIDWELVEKLYRAGQLSLREIAAKVDCTEGAIRKRAAKDGWSRDLREKIDQKAEELVRNQAVRKVSTQLTPADEREVIQVMGESKATVMLEERDDVTRARSLFGKLLKELEILTDNPELYEQLAELLDDSGPDSNGTWRKDKINEIYRKVISLDGRVDNARKLSEMLERVTKLRRSAFGIKDDEGKANPIDELLKRITPPGGGS